ncbi:hypothetical protein TMSI_27580 [Klebsiella quasipneumoniae]|nr:hypothetical protein TMSI_27580 [Klebsiella quasipneumoniae]
MQNGKRCTDVFFLCDLDKKFTNTSIKKYVFSINENISHSNADRQNINIFQGGEHLQYMGLGYF